MQPPHALLWSAQLCNDGMCDWAPPTRLSAGVVSDGRCAFVRCPRLTRIGESTLCSALPTPTTTRSCTQQSGSGRFRSLSAPGIARAGCARARVPMLALHAHHECVVSCLRLECRRRAESVVAIDRTDAAALAKPIRGSAFCLALLSRPPSAKCATNTNTRRAQGMLCEACRTGATKAYRRSECRCARARARSHCLISERILCSQRSIGFVGVGDGTMGRRRSDLRASHAKPTRCVARGESSIRAYTSRRVD